MSTTPAAAAASTSIRAAAVVVAMGFSIKHVLACRDRLQGKRRMTRRRRGDDHRVNMRQGILEVGIRRDPVLSLPTAVTDLGEPLVDADDSGHPGRGTEHADVPRTPVTHPDDADPNLASSCPHFPPPGSAPAAWIPIKHTRFRQPHLSPARTAPPHELLQLRQIRMTALDGSDLSDAVSRADLARLAILRQCSQPGSRQRYHLERGVDSELRHEAVQVGAHRVRGQLQPLRDLFPAGALDQEEQDVPLTRVRDASRSSLSRRWS